MCPQSFSQNYLNEIRTTFNTQIDGCTGGKKDGKVTVSEAYKNLNIGNMLAGLQPGSQGYIQLKSATSNMNQVLEKYAGADGIFTETEWANFLNGAEWGKALDAYHSANEWGKAERSKTTTNQTGATWADVGKMLGCLFNGIIDKFTT